jgi:hypothetical protein
VQAIVFTEVLEGSPDVGFRFLDWGVEITLRDAERLALVDVAEDVVDGATSFVESLQTSRPRR